MTSPHYSAQGQSQAAETSEAGPRMSPMSPNQRAWARFRRNRIGYLSMWLFLAMLLVSSLAELVSNDRPLLALYEGEFFVGFVP